MSRVDAIGRRCFDTRELVAAFPPRFTHANKRVVYRVANPPGSNHSGSLVFSRWKSAGLPEMLEPMETLTEFEHRECYFQYTPDRDSDSAVEWHLNFADTYLFCAYSGGLFAQDEMQVAEHPALGSLLGALLDSDLKPLTVENGEPTPALIEGVERRCRVAVDANAELGRPQGLYGNNFARASAEAVAKATQAIEPPTISNILAMAAPNGGYGPYTDLDIQHVLHTAYTGFTAARIASARDRRTKPRVIIHTGYWGCGAFGGNRVMMALLQMLAAKMSGVDRLVFHTGNAAGTRPYQEAHDLLRAVLGDGRRAVPLRMVILELEALGFEWGESDGN